MQLPKKQYHARTKRSLIFRLLQLPILLVLLISILPMIFIRFINPPTSSLIELNKRNANTQIQNTWVDIDNVSLYFPLAVIAAEDQQFPSHFGFDLTQIKLAIKQKKIGKQRGASTISQQLVKNLFLWPKRHYTRKAIEAWLTIWLELIVPKKRILELYINFAQLGTSVFGIGAASQYYFAIPASQLSLHQSALIAAVLPTPSRSTPTHPSKELLLRTEIIKDQMPRIGGRKIIRDL